MGNDSNMSSNASASMRRLGLNACNIKDAAACVACTVCGAQGMQCAAALF